MVSASGTYLSQSFVISHVVMKIPLCVHTCNYHTTISIAHCSYHALFPFIMASRCRELRDRLSRDPPRSILRSIMHLKYALRICFRFSTISHWQWLTTGEGLLRLLTREEAPLHRSIERAKDANRLRNRNRFSRIGGGPIEITTAYTCTYRIPLIFLFDFVPRSRLLLKFSLLTQESSCFCFTSHRPDRIVISKIVREEILTREVFMRPFYLYGRPEIVHWSLSDWHEKNVLLT